MLYLEYLERGLYLEYSREGALFRIYGRGYSDQPIIVARAYMYIHIYTGHMSILTDHSLMIKSQRGH